MVVKAQTMASFTFNPDPHFRSRWSILCLLLSRRADSSSCCASTAAYCERKKRTEKTAPLWILLPPHHALPTYNKSLSGNAPQSHTTAAVPFNLQFTAASLLSCTLARVLWSWRIFMIFLATKNCKAMVLQFSFFFSLVQCASLISKSVFHVYINTDIEQQSSLNEMANCDFLFAATGKSLIVTLVTH